MPHHFKRSGHLNKVWIIGNDKISLRIKFTISLPKYFLPSPPYIIGPRDSSATEPVRV